MHENIIKTFDIFQDLKHLYVVQELMDDNLDSLIHCHTVGWKDDQCPFCQTVHKSNSADEERTMPPLSNELILQIALAIARGMNYLHSLDNPVLHRDLKPDNVLLKYEAGDSIDDLSITSIKVSDFGIRYSSPSFHNHLLNGQ